jgi:hypothetical protein
VPNLKNNIAQNHGNGQLDTSPFPHHISHFPPETSHIQTPIAWYPHIHGSHILRLPAIELPLQAPMFMYDLFKSGSDCVVKLISEVNPKTQILTLRATIIRTILSVGCRGWFVDFEQTIVQFLDAVVAGCCRRFLKDVLGRFLILQVVIEDVADQTGVTLLPIFVFDTVQSFEVKEFVSGTELVLLVGVFVDIIKD